jgi:hypothetical protein
MPFLVNNLLPVLESTPAVLMALLGNLGRQWTAVNEGPDTWTAEEVLAHLIICEQTDWLVRTHVFLGTGGKTLAPIDMQAHFELAQNNSLSTLLHRFANLRLQNLASIKALNLTTAQLQQTAIHPKLGEVTLQQHLATWVTHDLNHLAQITRIMARQNKVHTGPFATFLPILKDKVQP